MFMSKWYFHPYDAAKVINNFQSAKQFGKKNENSPDVFVHGNKKKRQKSAAKCHMQSLTYYFLIYFFVPLIINPL